MNWVQINADISLLSKLCKFCYFIFKACNCYVNGSNGIACDDNGVCSCKANFMNDKCDACNDGFFNFPTCEGNQYINPTSIKLDLTFLFYFKSL